MKKERIAAIFLALTLLFSLTACAGQTQTEESTPTLRAVVCAPLATLDPAMYTSAGESSVLSTLFEGLMRVRGGKTEPGETDEEALVREIREELEADISVDGFLCAVEYDYPKFHMVMRCYLCSLASDHLVLLEHEAAEWLPLDRLDSVRWLPSDIEVIEKIRLLK